LHIGEEKNNIDKNSNKKDSNQKIKHLLYIEDNDLYDDGIRQIISNIKKNIIHLINIFQNMNI